MPCLEPDLSVSEAKCRQPGRRVHLITAAIPGLLRRSAVIPQPIRPDDQTVFGPEEVDPKAIEPHPRLGRGQSGIAHQSQEQPLEFRVGQPENPTIKEADERADPMATHRLQSFAQPRWIDSVEFVGLVDRCL
jgi:hypothetical protein